jgi:hypothetical protein
VIFKNKELELSGEETIMAYWKAIFSIFLAMIGKN